VRVGVTIKLLGELAFHRLGAEPELAKMRLDRR